MLAGKRVLVTGGSSGIGEATAVAAAAAGAQVGVLGRDEQRVRKVAERVGGEPVVADVTDLNGAQQVVDRAAKALGGLDGLVNAAGVMVAGSVAETDPGEWQRMFEVNVLGLLAITRAAMPHLAESEAGSVVNISSMAGRRIPRAEAGVYAASKAAVHTISETLRLELQPQGVRVTTVAPGFVRTPLADDWPEGELRDFFRSRLTELGLDPETVAHAVVHVLAQPPGIAMVEYAVVPTAQ